MSTIYCIMDIYLNLFILSRFLITSLEVDMEIYFYLSVQLSCNHKQCSFEIDIHNGDIFLSTYLSRYLVTISNAALRKISIMKISLYLSVQVSGNHKQCSFEIDTHDEVQGVCTFYGACRVKRNDYMLQVFILRGHAMILKNHTLNFKSNFPPKEI